MITKDMIEVRKTSLINDLQNTKIKQQEIDKLRLENVGLQNALTGAIQQCDDFLKKFDDDISDEG
jgi:hypothetical protein|tara:strand:- start:310 stop:504 length:195 start_codon:yes stop_codon:yes gene_type:complete